MRTSRSISWPACAWLLLALAGATPARGATYRVEPPDLIADALALAAAGDTVLVAAGTYQEQGLTMPEAVTLLGETGNPDDVVLASLGGQSILFCLDVSAATLVQGLTFAVSDVGFPAPVSTGGGVTCERAAPRFADCRFRGLAAGYGGAVFCRDASPDFAQCAFLGNQAVAAGGALNAVGASLVTLTQCVLAGNTSGGAGGAVNTALGARVLLSRSTVAQGAAAGGALSAWATDPSEISGTIVALNDGSAWAGEADAAPAVACTDIWGNGADWSGALAPLDGQDGNLADDPMFCGVLAPAQPWGLDVSSPCLQAPCGPMGAFDAACDASTGIDDPPPGGPPSPPEATQLLGNRPNPFNPSTTVTFALRRPGPVTLAVYDVAGRLVRRLVSASFPAGIHEVTWRGDDATGRTAAAGVYFLRLSADGIFDTRRMALVK